MLQRKPCFPRGGGIHKSTSMLSVIIPTFNSERMLVPTLAMLISGAMSGVVRQVTIVDGGSPDATLLLADPAASAAAVSFAPPAPPPPPAPAPRRSPPPLVSPPPPRPPPHS